MRILAFDASTATIGLAVLECGKNKIDLVHLEHFKPPKKGHLFERLSKVREYVFKKIDELKPDEVVIEDIILGLPGATTANTIAVLAVLNRTVGLSVFDKLGKPPHLYSVMKIRHTIKENKILPKKEEIPELVAKILNISFPYIMNKNKKHAVENYDRADAIACGVAFIKREIQIEKAKSSRKKKI